MRRLLGCLIVVALLAACGDGVERVTAGNETFSQADVCVTPHAPVDSMEDSARISDEQERLSHDVERIREYGEAHPDEFTRAGYDNSSKVISVGVFTRRLEEHRAALLPLLQHPDEFDVQQGVLSARASRAVRQAIEEDPALGFYNFLLYDTANGHVGVGLYSTKQGRAAGKKIHERWGRGVCVEIAGHPYPKGAWPDTTRCHGTPMTSERNPDVGFELIPDQPELARGERGTGTARVTNRGRSTLEATLSTDVYAQLAEPGDATAIGSIIGPKTLVGPGTVQIGPGETREFPLTFGTDDCRPEGDYAIPAGEYVLMASLPGVGRADDVTITITE